MKKYKNRITYRILLTAVLILVQMAWFIYSLMKLARYSTLLSIGFGLLSAVVALHVIKKDENPAYQIAWLVPILLLPLLGGLLYLCFGDKKPSRGMQRVLNLEYEVTKPLKIQDAEVTCSLEQTDARFAGTSHYVADCGFPVSQQSEVTYYSIGEEMFSDMMAEMEQAKRYIFLEYFIIEEGIMWDQMLELMTRKVAEGVDVRLIYDDMGSVAKLPGRYDREMEKRGIRCMRFNPVVPFFSLVMNNRDHRKILVVDGHTAFTGGINLSDEYINAIEKFGHWKDTGIRVKGEAVWNFTLMFLEMWNAYRKYDQDLAHFMPRPRDCSAFTGDGFVQPYADSPLDNENIGENVYMEILSQAQNYVYIMTPYLILDYELKTALCQAARRGVDVRIITPGIPDKPTVYRLTRSYYPCLLEAGVRIFEYTPGFVHAKSFVCDDKMGVVGTINLDYRSLYLHFECAALLYGCPALMDLKRDSLETMEKSKEVRLLDCRQKLLGQLLDAVLRVFAPLM